MAKRVTRDSHAGRELGTASALGEKNMSWESIGSISTGEMPYEEAWIVFGLNLAKQYVKFVCGEAPPGSKLGIMWHEHELGRYPSLGLWSEDEPPWDYLDACERALDVFDEAAAWHELKEHYEEQVLSEEEEDQDEYNPNVET